jgi:hypothetical protein
MSVREYVDGEKMCWGLMVTDNKYVYILWIISTTDSMRTHTYTHHNHSSTRHTHTCRTLLTIHSAAATSGTQICSHIHTSNQCH